MYFITAEDAEIAEEALENPLRSQRTLRFLKQSKLGPILGLIIVAMGTLIAKPMDLELHEQNRSLAPEKSLATMVIQDGYEMELIAAEPFVEEPVLAVYDGRGRMYVAEMLTYMQDIDATGEMEPVSRIKRLEDIDDDGVMDRATVFAENLLLPRMILPLEDGRIIIRETNTSDLWLLTDVDGDGVSDKRERVFEGGPRGGNLEHQPSGLIWGIDNYIYTTVTDKRYRWNGERILEEELSWQAGQWGIGQDETGRMYFSTAGGENPAYGFQFPMVYGKFLIRDAKAEGFREVFPLDKTPDIQGGPKRFREDGTLNAFTGCAGQSVFVGDALGSGFVGNLIVPEPVGNLVRRAQVSRDDGFSTLSHAYQEAGVEFIASTDPNFRPVWSGTSPDGSLYLVDMYRGIIQEGNWTKEGSYLREVVQEYGFDKNIGRGRIYRVFKPGVKRNAQPNLYDESTAKLVTRLAHPNGWWRLEAQKLLVLRKDDQSIARLRKMASRHRNGRARLHALWTLDGLGSSTRELLIEKFDDADSDVRCAAIRISENFANDGDESVLEEWVRLASDADVEVAQQVFLSAYYLRLEESKMKPIRESAFAVHPESKGLQIIQDGVEWSIFQVEEEARLEAHGHEFATSMKKGKSNYESLCFTCHGADGRGTAVLGSGFSLAPSLLRNPRLLGDVASLARIVSHGLNGPVDGKQYPGGLMAPMASNGAAWLADVLTYARNAFGNQAGRVSEYQVARVMEWEWNRAAPWSLEELKGAFGNRLTDKEAWKLSASHSEDLLKYAIDGSEKNPWETAGQIRSVGMWFQIELPRTARIGLITDTVRFPEGCHLEVSKDGLSWEAVVDGETHSDVMSIEALGAVGRFIRISLKKGARDRLWKIRELEIYGSYL